MRALTLGFSLRGWSRGDILALAGVVAAIAVATVPPLRRYLMRQWRAALMRAGFPRRRYAKWFVQRWGIYENPYLDDKENLDLSNTYVPLSFRSQDSDQETLSIATAVLADQQAGNLVIEGAPGSGKSTLLKAYGVGVLQDSHAWPRAQHVVPFLIQLRKLARYPDKQHGLADYLVEEILVSGAGLSPERARQFLGYTLSRGQALVMLDGLDEVTADRYQAVLEAVVQFVGDHRPDCPTYRARVLVTCRQQNFLGMHDEWVPAVAARRVCSLAPLRNSEIFSYLNKLRPKFKAADGPESFMQAVRTSGTLDLHRVPLILAMSVGLYARKDYFEIPSSIARLYQAMIEEMLDRHRFKSDPGGKALVFQVGDKYRFLRQFALLMARGERGFDEFSRADLDDVAVSMAPDLDAVREPRTFVDEIVLRSGLITDVAEADQSGETDLRSDLITEGSRARRYLFAHRSIHEYLAADELRAAGDGDDFLLDKADDPEWRQVIQFYAAAQEQRQVSAFLRKLIGRNHALAGFCLVSAKASDDVAVEVLDALAPVDDIRLAALAAATMSPRLSVQDMAIGRLRKVLLSGLSWAIGNDVEATLPLLGSLAGTNAAEIAELVPETIENVADDPRLVEPLWRCLAAPGIERLPASSTIVRRLLTLAMDPNGLEELARQDPYVRDFLTADIRRQAYPFTKGLGPEHNLVTLLAWADYLNVNPADSNRFFQAKAAGRLGRIEADRRRTVAFSLFWPARILSSGITLAAAAVAVPVLIAGAHQLVHPFGLWTLGIIIGAALVPPIMLFGIEGYWVESLPKTSRLKYHIDAQEEEDCGNIFGLMISKIPDLAFLAIIILLPLVNSIAAVPLLKHSLTSYFIVTEGAGLLFFTFFLDMFSRSRRYYLYRPNPYVDIYDDPRSRLWLGGSTSRTTGSGT